MKTLKDLEWEINKEIKKLESGDLYGRGYPLSIEIGKRALLIKFRREAIKRIKKWKRELEVQYEEYDNVIIPNEPLCSELKAKIEAFIEFFNITGDELI